MNICLWKVNEVFKKKIFSSSTLSTLKAAVISQLRGWPRHYACVCLFDFKVYVAEVTADVATCTKRNTHQRKQAELQKVS